MTDRIFEFNSALVREPARSVVDGLSSQSGPRPVYEVVLSEHQQYVGTVRECGLAVEILPPLEEFPDSVFVEDPAFVIGDTAVVLRPGATTRMGEAGLLAPVLRRRFSRVLQLEEGFADGGDLLLTPRGLFIGLSSRTDAQGARALAELLRGLGIASRIVNTPADTLHLKSDCSLVAADQVLCTAALGKSGLFDGFRKIIVPDTEKRAANALRLNDTVLLGEGFPATAELLRREGLDVRQLPVTEIGRIDAGLSCMSLRWQAPGAASV